MDVNFNNVRKQTCFTYDRLVRKLNASIDDSGEIIIDAGEIQEVMDRLRGLIMTSAYVYKQGDEDFKMVGDDVGDIAWFNSDNQV